MPIPDDEQYLHTPGWQRMLADAAQDIRAGRVRTVTVDELMAEVDGVEGRGGLPSLWRHRHSQT